MNCFSVQLFQQTGAETLDDVVLFAGEDASGSFAIQARHAHFMTALTMGLARLQYGSGACEYLALPGGLLYVRDNLLTINTRRYWRGADYASMNNILNANVNAEANSLKHIKTNVQQIEEVMLRRLMQLERHT